MVSSRHYLNALVVSGDGTCHDTAAIDPFVEPRVPCSQVEAMLKRYKVPVLLIEFNPDTVCPCVGWPAVVAETTRLAYRLQPS